MLRWLRRAASGGRMRTVDRVKDRGRLDVIVVGATVDAVGGIVTAAETAADGIHGWIRCGSGLLRVVRGRPLPTMSLWI